MSRRRLGVPFAALLAAAGGWLYGCGWFGGGGPQTREIVLIGSEKLNSCGEGIGNTLPVRVYQLAGETSISVADMGRLWSSPEDVLGDEFLHASDLILEPGRRVTFPVTPAEGTRYIAVVGNFCQTEGDCWKWFRPLRRVRSPMSLTFGEFCISETQ